MIVLSLSACNMHPHAHSLHQTTGITVEPCFKASWLGPQKLLPPKEKLILKNKTAKMWQEHKGHTDHFQQLTKMALLDTLSYIYSTIQNDSFPSCSSVFTSGHTSLLFLIFSSCITCPLAVPESKFYDVFVPA